ncbi:forkhead box protein D1-like [Amia ocellicauda]|uniref:forkhead box protein D1-like n=1 Tax=Amia ocellicauda TaxID=2972642 RepID=UPI00346453B8
MKRDEGNGCENRQEESHESMCETSPSEHAGGICFQLSGGNRDVPRKPSLSYVELIARAILSSPLQKLNLASIYKDIEHQFPFYRSQGHGWKNSVRHNLSLNDCFVKVGRCEDGKGNYWGIHPSHLNDFLGGNFRQHRKAKRKRHPRDLRGPYDMRCFSGFASCLQCSLQPGFFSRTQPSSYYPLPLWKPNDSNHPLWKAHLWETEKRCAMLASTLKPRPISVEYYKSPHVLSSPFHTVYNSQLVPGVLRAGGYPVS